jgi:hypothetical protein
MQIYDNKAFIIYTGRAKEQAGQVSDPSPVINYLYGMASQHIISP